MPYSSSIPSYRAGSSLFQPAHMAPHDNSQSQKSGANFETAAFWEGSIARMRSDVNAHHSAPQLDIDNTDFIKRIEFLQ